jgi:hypothetical protein
MTQQGTGLSGMGTVFNRWNSTTSKWVEIAEVKKIGWSGMSRKTFDTTTLSTPGGYETFGVGLRTAGSLKVDMNFTRAAFDAMKADFDSDVMQNYELLLPDTDNTSFEFEGLVTECPFDIPQDQITLSVTIKINGVVNTESGSNAIS